MVNKTINYESDFKIIEGFKDGSSILAAPFRFTYYTKVPRGVYVAEYNGSEFVNCIPTEDGRVIVPFDSPKLGMGVLMVKREFFLNDSNFSDGICNLVSVESTGITLDKGATDDLGEIDVLIEPYYHTIGSGGGGEIPNGSVTEYKLANGAVSTPKIKDGAVTESKLSEEVCKKLNKAGGQGEKGEKGDKMTYDDLTEAEKDDLASRVPAPDVDLSEYAKKSDVPTKTSELTNDRGFVTSDELTTAISQSITNVLNTEV